LKEKKNGSANNKRGEEVNDSEGDIKFSEDGWSLWTRLRVIRRK